MLRPGRLADLEPPIALVEIVPEFDLVLFAVGLAVVIELAAEAPVRIDLDEGAAIEIVAAGALIVVGGPVDEEHRVAAEFGWVIDPSGFGGLGLRAAAARVPMLGDRRVIPLVLVDRGLPEVQGGVAAPVIDGLIRVGILMDGVVARLLAKKVAKRLKAGQFLKREAADGDGAACAAVVMAVRASAMRVWRRLGYAGCRRVSRVVGRRRGD